MMMWHKPENLKYVDLCIYIDEHSKELIMEPRNTKVEDLIYNYIWLLVKALAIKKRMFNNFSDYDGYASYSANRLYFALKKSYLNEGKKIKGKTIKPIKSILNYTKALMYPMKLEYINEQYKSDQYAEDTAKKFDEFTYEQKVSENAWYDQGGNEDFKNYVEAIFENFTASINKVLSKAPFKQNSTELKHLKISILLNCLKNLNSKKGIATEPIVTATWKLPKSMSNYIKLFIKELGTELKIEIMECYRDTQLDERILTYMMTNPDGEFVNNEE